MILSVPLVCVHLPHPSSLGTFNNPISCINCNFSVRILSLLIWGEKDEVSAAQLMEINTTAAAGINRRLVLLVKGNVQAILDKIALYVIIFFFFFSSLTVGAG